LNEEIKDFLLNCWLGWEMHWVDPDAHSLVVAVVFLEQVIGEFPNPLT